MLSGTVKQINKNNFVIVSDCIHGPTTLSAEYGYKAFESGADMFASIVREKYFSNEQIFNHFEFLSQQLAMPLLVHEMPFLSGFDAKKFKMAFKFTSELKNIENIVAIKEDAKDLEYGKKVIDILEPDIRIIFAGKKRYINELYPFGLKLPEWYFNCKSRYSIYILGSAYKQQRRYSNFNFEFNRRSVLE